MKSAALFQSPPAPRTVPPAAPPLGHVELTRAQEERQAELDAARPANRDLTRALHQRG
ncbi:hypothetical protein PV721_40595 [Streptomyces sp. MB09-01]|uniref:hypothetical protein n=1 Tax=Streptomyces sp. MB09-01 TaxID=3028666 RepID=UPI0029BA4B88|nr:hypothetical protein [Streptomyces sp. MB09-01]MDX3540494.1 hypothetical protein [Streptomyces sp. MB09-01]